MTSQVYAGPLEGGKASVVLLNRAASAHAITVAFADLAANPAFQGAGGASLFPYAGAGQQQQQQVKVRDLWAHQDLGSFGSGSYSALVGPHEVVHVVLELVEGPAPTPPHIIFILLDGAFK